VENGNRRHRDAVALCLSGRQVKLSAYCKTAADHVTVSLSTNNGRSFTPLWTTDRTGVSETVLELKERVLRRYAYQLKVEIVASTPQGAGLTALAAENDLQHAPRTLPWLGKGATPSPLPETAIPRWPPGPSPAVSPPIPSLLKTRPHRRWRHLRQSACGRWNVLVDRGVGTMTVPIETPGEMVALRFGAHIRARGAKDGSRCFSASMRAKPGRRRQRSWDRLPRQPSTSALPPFRREPSGRCCATN